MRSLEELIDTHDPGWPVVEEWISAADHSVEVLPVDPVRAGQVLTLLQVTTRSPLGAIAHHTGGLLVDRWLRLLGGGGPRMKADLAAWNGLGESPQAEAVPGALVVGLDVVGGVFALFAETGTVNYFSPSSLEWEDLERAYSDFVVAMLRTDLDEFYRGLRWKDWQKDVATLELDSGIQSWPPPWTVEAKTEPVSRRPVPLTELVRLGFDFARQLAPGR
jgi:hypothetical protein